MYSMCEELSEIKVIFHSLLTVNSALIASSRDSNLKGLLNRQIDFSLSLHTHTHTHGKLKPCCVWGLIWCVSERSKPVHRYRSCLWRTLDWTAWL